MLSLAAIGAVLRRVPGIAWVILLAVAIATAAVVGVYRAGENKGEAKVHGVALKDSTTKQVATVDRTAKASDSIGAIAAKAVRSSTTGRAQTRAVLEAERDTIPPSVIAVISAQLDRDSTTIAVLVAKSDADHTERLARVELDTLRKHAETFDEPGGGISATDVVVTVGIVATVAEAVRLVIRLLHR